MKRLLTLSVIVLFFSVASYAQDKMNIQVLIDPGLSMGGKYQVPGNITTGTDWTSLKKSVKFGMDAGVSFGYNFTENIGASVGLMYAMQGQKYKTYTWTVGNQTMDWKRTVSMNYLKIPIQANYIINPEADIRFTASLGIYVGFLLGYKDKNEAVASDGSSLVATAKGTSYTQDVTTPNGSNSQTVTFNNGKPYKTVDVGALIGVGVEFKISEKLSIPLGINYQIGFLNVKNTKCSYQNPGSAAEQLFWQNSTNDSPNATLAYHNSSIELKVGIKLAL